MIEHIGSGRKPQVIEVDTLAHSHTTDAALDADAVRKLSEAGAARTDAGLGEEWAT